MANIKGQIKRNIKNEKENAANRQSRSKLKTLIKKSLESNNIDSSNKADSKKILNNAIAYTDSCQSKGLIKKNKANRIKSKLMKANFNSSSTVKE